MHFRQGVSIGQETGFVRR